MRLTGAHDEAWSRVFRVDGPGHVGVVGPAQVQVEVTVGLQTDATHNEAAWIGATKALTKAHLWALLELLDRLVSQA